MSRIGRKPITIPADVEVKLDGTKVTVKGPKGTLEREIHRDMKVTVENNEIIVTRPSDDKEHRSLHGLTRTLISNMVDGVVKPFEKKLEANGVGYRVAVQGKDLVMNLGYSHQVIMPIPSTLELKVEPGNKITVSGCDKQEVGQFAAEIRTKRPPEPYLGKGIKYADEVIRRKEGKAGKGGKK